MIRRPPISTRTDTLFPYTTLFRSIGILMILFFGVMLRWLPSFGRGDVVQLGWWSTGFLTKSGWQSLIMPAFTLALFQMTLIMRLVRAEMLEVLQTDFIKFARARGLPARMINRSEARRVGTECVSTCISGWSP